MPKTSNAHSVAPRNRVMVRGIVRARNIDGLTFSEIGRRYQVSGVSAFRTYRRWRDWADEPTPRQAVVKAWTALEAARHLLDHHWMMALLNNRTAEVGRIKSVLAQIADARELARPFLPKSSG